VAVYFRDKERGEPMITVRFPTGFSVQYNDVNHVEYTGNIARLTHNPGNKWYADVMLSSGAIIEVYAPCRTYNANQISDDTLADAVLDRLRHLPGHKLVKLKRAVADFNIQRHTWKAAE